MNETSPKVRSYTSLESCQTKPPCGLIDEKNAAYQIRTSNQLFNVPILYVSRQPYISAGS